MRIIQAIILTLSIMFLVGCSQAPVSVEISLPKKVFEVAEEIPLTVTFTPVREANIEIGDGSLVFWTITLALHSPDGQRILGHETYRRDCSPLVWYPATKAKPLVKVFELSSLLRNCDRPWERAFMGDQTGTYRIRYEGAKAITYVRSMQNTNQVWSGEVSSNELAFEVKPPSPASIRKAFHTLSDEDASTESKLRAIEVLKLRQDEAVIRTMTNLVAGTNTVVGLAALGVLDRIRSPEFFDIFVSCLTRPDPQMQCLAFWAIGEYPESRKKKLTKMLAEEYKRGPARKSHFALLALARYGDESTLTILEEIAAKYKDEFIQRDVQKRINKIKAEQQERQRQGP